MNKLLFLIFLSFVITACSKNDSNIVLQVMKIPELKFTFEDSIYIINNPKIDRFIDTLNYDINEPILLFNEFFSIEGRINDTQDFTAFITNSIVEPSSCMPEIIYYEDYEIQELENQCIYFTPSDESWCEKSHCNSASISLRTVLNDTTTSIARSNHGFFMIEECLNDTVAGVFESKHFKNGTFKNISLR